MIRGSRVTLRPACEDDRRAVYQWLAQSDLTASMLGPPDFCDAPAPDWDQFCKDYGAHFFDGTRQDIGRSYIIEADGQAVGHVNYDGMDLARRFAELDIWLRSSEVCGRGFGSDALLALTRHLHEAFGITEFILRPSRRNTRAMRAYAKAGFLVLPLTNEEQAERHGPGDYSDTVVMVKSLSGVSLPMTLDPYADAPAAYHEYDPDAPAVARLLADVITAADASLAVEHIGSTAVPGCAGKGIIDLMVLYTPGHLPHAKRTLDELGFQPQTTRDPFPADRPMRVAAVMHNGKRFLIHAHVIAVNAEEPTVLRAFRDRLRMEPEVRLAYEACKRRILAAGVTDAVDYAEAKTEFIKGRSSET